jgi:MOB kinase activator 1
MCFLHCGLLWVWSRNQRTFRPKKSTPSGSKGAQLRKHIDATLGSGNLREAVRLPPGEDLFEWLAVNSKILLQFVFLLRERESNQNPLRTY